ncbi:MAG: hypothetical protein PWQ59_2151 [Thermoanaerobacterium sp.]|nr:hypothetical protein [Thermoanaerobacterium sp.]
MLKVVIPSNQDKIKRQIEALEWQITQDTDEKSRRIHEEVLEALGNALKGLDKASNRPFFKKLVSSGRS